MAARFHVDTLDWYRADEPVRHLPALARAVLDRRPVTMRYDSWTGVREWRIEPLGLVLKAGAWYLAARGRGKIRTFRVSNILGQAIEEGSFERPADFDLPAYWSASLARFEAQLRPGSAALRASPVGLKRLAELGAYAAKAVAQAGPPEADGWARLAFPVEAVERAALTLLGIGPEIEVIEPADLRDAVRALAAEIAAR